MGNSGKDGDTDALRTKKKGFQGEVDYVHRDGSIVDGKFNVAFVRDDEGRAIGLFPGAGGRILSQPGIPGDPGQALHNRQPGPGHEVGHERVTPSRDRRNFLIRTFTISGYSTTR